MPLSLCAYAAVGAVDGAVSSRKVVFKRLAIVNKPKTPPTSRLVNELRLNTAFFAFRKLGDTTTNPINNNNNIRHHIMSFGNNSHTALDRYGRIDLMKVQTMQRHCLKLFPKGKKSQQKIVLGDDSGIVQSFGIKKGYVTVCSPVIVIAIIVVIVSCVVIAVVVANVVLLEPRLSYQDSMIP